MVCWCCLSWCWYFMYSWYFCSFVVIIDIAIFVCCMIQFGLFLDTFSYSSGASRIPCSLSTGGSVSFFLLFFGRGAVSLLFFFFSFWKGQSLSPLRSWQFVLQYYACVTVFMVMAFNMWLTKRTYETDPGTQRQPHIHFCTIVGGEISLKIMFLLIGNILGFCSFLSPCLALFFNQTTSTRNLNYFYKVGGEKKLKKILLLQNNMYKNSTKNNV